MSINILVADCKKQMCFVKLKLSELFENNVYFTNSVLELSHLLEERQYALAIVNPFELHSITPLMEHFLPSERARYILHTIKQKGVPVIFVQDEITPESLQLQYEKHYDAINNNPYKVEQLIAQIRALTGK
ncbi:hypothetical protein HY485_00470 [Candidatus Woesearchaeota archaeon]|nr:hypothetical protein [Candidatus Woesearchaeota archaeon]